MLEEIKSVRIRPGNESSVTTTDIKIKITFDKKSRYLQGLNSNGRQIWYALSYDNKRYSGHTDDELILDFIRTNDKKENYYKIIQDPWTDQPPIWRSYGFDPYYLNNGTKVFIKWTNGTLSQGGKSWSDDSGNELSKSMDVSQDKSNITKHVQILSESEQFEIDKNGLISKSNYNWKEYASHISDIDILNELISLWKMKVPNYDLEVCSPSNQSCYIIEYISPIAIQVNNDVDPTTQPTTPPKTKLSIVLPKDKSYKAKEDISLRIWIGEPPKDNSSGFDFGDYEDNSDLLDAQYREVDFGGEEESEMEISSQNEADYSESSNTISDAPMPITDGEWTYDIVPGRYVDNSGNKIELCQINGKPINIKISGKYFDMRAAAKKDGISLNIISGFRSPYDPIKTKSSKGVDVSTQSQKQLYDKYKSGKGNLAAEPGKSNHGNGIGLDLNTGSRKKGTLNKQIYSWLVKNSWKWGFVRAVHNEEWHFDYLPSVIDRAKSSKSYAKLSNTEAHLFYKDLGLNNLT